MSTFSITDLQRKHSVNNRKNTELISRFCPSSDVKSMSDKSKKEKLIDKQQEEDRNKKEEGGGK